MVFDWDERKNRRNQAKHHVSFEAATLVFEDPQAITILDRKKERNAGKPWERRVGSWCCWLYIPIGKRAERNTYE
jgi:uncharacterized DUF497 family protein